MKNSNFQIWSFFPKFEKIFIAVVARNFKVRFRVSPAFSSYSRQHLSIRSRMKLLRQETGLLGSLKGAVV